MIQVLSLGAGVQSTTVLLMSCRGELPQLDCAIFSDTQWESKATYAHLEWLEGEARKAGIPVIRVTRGNLRQDAIDFRQYRKSVDRKRYASMPVFIANPDGSQGIVRRQCTAEYKIEPIERFIKAELLGLRPRQRAPKAAVVEQWFGISADEASRMRTSDCAWKTHIYPLCGVPYDYLPRPIRRKDCLEWLSVRYPGRVVPRSACLACPYRSDAEWRQMRAEDPAGFEDAVDFDRAIRIAEANGQANRKKMVVGLPYVHRSMRPLGEVDFSTLEERGQMNLFENECSGMCGV